MQFYNLITDSSIQSNTKYTNNVVQLGYIFINASKQILVTTHMVQFLIPASVMSAW